MKNFCYPWRLVTNEDNVQIWDLYSLKDGVVACIIQRKSNQYNIYFKSNSSTTTVSLRKAKKLAESILNVTVLSDQLSNLQ